jgi:hypothetical protein
MNRRFQAAGGKVTGILWYRGESDANAKDGLAPAVLGIRIPPHASNKQ